MSITSTTPTAADLDSVPWNTLLKEREPLDDHAVSEVYRKASEKAEAGGLFQEANVYRFISVLMSFYFNLEHSEHPFQPFAQFATSRSAQGDDIEEAEFDLIRKLASEASNLSLLARANDLLWTFKRDFQAAARAVDAYLEIAEHTFDPSSWTASEHAYRRALQVGLSLGKNPASTKVVDAVKNAILKLDGSDPLFFTVKLVENLLDMTREKLNHLVPTLEKAITLKLPEPNWRRTVQLLEVLRRIHQRSGNDEDARQSIIRIAETHKAQYEADKGKGAFVAKDRLEKAVVAYRRAGNSETEIAALMKVLDEVQRRIPDELQQISTEIDLTDVTKESRAIVKGKPLAEAIRSFGLSLQAPSKAKLRADTEGLNKQFVLNQIFSKVIVGEGGRKVANVPSPVSATQGQIDASLEAEMMLNLRHYWMVESHGRIFPMIELLQREHRITLSELREITSYNPFIPEGAEETYLLGLQHGFNSEFAQAVSLLIPAFENSLRHILEVDGLATWKYDREGVQDVKSLNELFAPKAERGHREDLEARLHDDLVFELRALLTERFGANLRNQHAHGLLTYAEYFGPAAITFWGKVLFLLVTGAHLRDKQINDQQVPESPPTEPEPDTTQPKEKTPDA